MLNVGGILDIPHTTDTYFFCNMQPYSSLLHVAQQTSDLLTYRDDYDTIVSLKTIKLNL